MLTKAEIVKQLEEHQITAQEAFLEIKQLSEMQVADVQKNNLEYVEPEEQGDWLPQVKKELVQICSEITKLEKEDIKGSEDIKNYGLDSIGMGIFTSRIGECYAIDLNPILLMEYSSIDEIASVMLEQFPTEIAGKYQRQNKKTESKNQMPVQKNSYVLEEKEKSVEECKQEFSVSAKSDREFLKNIGRKKGIAFEEEDICILKISKNFNEDYFVNFWADFEAGKIKNRKVSRISKKLFMQLVEEGYLFEHMLVSNAEGKKMEVTIAGTGEPLLIVGGMGMTASVLVHQYRELLNEFRLIDIHMPGCGLSEEIPDLSLNGIAENMMEVMEKIGIEKKINLLGLSWGGMVVSTFAYQFPEKCKSLILVNTIYESEVFLDISSDEMIQRDLKENGCMICYKLISKSMSLDVDMYDKYMKYLVQGTSQTHTTKDILPYIEIPALIVKSLNDKVVNPQKSDDIQSMMKQSEIISIENAGHFVMLSQFQKFNQIVRDFILDEAAQFQRKPAFSLKEHEAELTEFKNRASEMFGIQHFEDYGNIKSELDELCIQYILDYWKEEGIELCEGTSFVYPELLKKFQVINKFKKFFDYFILVLKEQHYLEENNNVLSVVKDGNYRKSAKEKNNILREQYPQFSGLLELLNKCGENLHGAISGKISAINILFPDGSPDYMDTCSRNTAAFGDDKVYSNTIGRLIEIFVQKRNRGGKVKVLEIGGGQGLMTMEIVPVLKNPEIEYCFTDISDYILKNMENHIGLKNVEFRRFDISKDIEEQGFQKESFDMVIGLDVVHATPDIQKTLDNLKKLLYPGGVIALTEVINPQIWQQIIWGYAEGWWYFEDYDLRTDVPVMCMDKWEQVFRNSGFDGIISLSGKKEQHLVFDSGCIMGQKIIEF